MENQSCVAGLKTPHFQNRKKNEMSKSIKAVGYGRTSSESGDEKISVDVQKADFEKACLKEGWQNLGWFEDRDVSGRAYPVGSEFIQLDKITSSYLSNKPASKRTRKGFAAALASGASVLWVRDTTRFARPLSGSYMAPYLRSELIRLGITLYTGDTGKVDFDKLETSLVQNIQSEIEDSSIKTKVAQSKASRNTIRDNGGLYCKPDCLGFRYSGRKQVQAIQSELETVKQIFSLYLSGKTIRQITVHLNQSKIKPYKQGKMWYRRSVSQCLSRPWYAGLQTNSDGKLIHSQIFKPHAIVSVKNFQTVQNRLSGNVSAGVKRESKFAHPLAGLIRCGHCRMAMSSISSRRCDKDGTKGQLLRFYSCNTSDKDKSTVHPDCATATIRETMYDLVPIDAPNNFYQPSTNLTPPQMDGLIEALHPFTLVGYIQQLKEADTTPALLSKRQDLISQIDTLTKKAVTRYEDMESGFISRDVYQSLTLQSKSQTDTLNSELMTVEKQIKSASATWTLNTTSFADLWSMSHHTYSALLRKFVSAVYVHPDKIEIETTSNQTITIPRIKIRNGRQLPKHIEDFGYGQHITVKYQFPSDQLPKSKTLFKSETMTILAVPLQA